MRAQLFLFTCFIALTACGQKEETAIPENVILESAEEKAFVGFNFVEKSSAENAVQNGKFILQTLGKLPGGGKKSALTFEIDDEAKYSGKKINITITANSGAFEVVYSTNDVGHSGWQKMTTSFSPKQVSFEYDVPEMKAGKGDFIKFNGIDPNVEITDIKIDIIG